MDVVAQAGCAHRNRLINRRRGGGTAVGNARGVRESLDAEAAREIDLVAVVDRERHHAVDVMRTDAGVVAGGDRAFGGELQLAAAGGLRELGLADRSEEHTSELQSLMRISYAVFCLKKKNINNTKTINKSHHM